MPSGARRPLNVDAPSSTNALISPRTLLVTPPSAVAGLGGTSLTDNRNAWGRNR